MEITQRLREDDEIQVIAEKHNKKEIFLKRLFPHKGHKVFEKNLLTGEISEADVEWNDVYTFDPKWYPNKPIPRKGKVVIKEGYEYKTFLNKANAKKKWNLKKQYEQNE